MSSLYSSLCLLYLTALLLIIYPGFCISRTHKPIFKALDLIENTLKILATKINEIIKDNMFSIILRTVGF